MATAVVTAMAGQHTDKWDGNDFLDGDEYDNQQEIRRRRVDGINLSPATSGLRRIGGGPLQMGTNDSGGAA